MAKEDNADGRDKMNEESLKRREALKRIALAIAAGSLASLAGCSNSDDGEDITYASCYQSLATVNGYSSTYNSCTPAYTSYSSATYTSYSSATYTSYSSRYSSTISHYWYPN